MDCTGVASNSTMMSLPTASSMAWWNAVQASSLSLCDERTSPGRARPFFVLPGLASWSAVLMVWSAGLVAWRLSGFPWGGGWCAAGDFGFQREGAGRDWGVWHPLRAVPSEEVGCHQGVVGSRRVVHGLMRTPCVVSMGLGEVVEAPLGGARWRWRRWSGRRGCAAGVRCAPGTGPRRRRRHARSGRGFQCSSVRARARGCARRGPRPGSGRSVHGRSRAAPHRSFGAFARARCGTRPGDGGAWPCRHGPRVVRSMTRHERFSSRPCRLSSVRCSVARTAGRSQSRATRSASSASRLDFTAVMT